MDEYGYPENHELKKIAKWNIPKGDIKEFLDYLQSKWHWPDWGFKKRNGRTQFFKKPCIKLELHTGGWSGNESLIGALEKNWMFWSLFWVSSKRGGHYSFEINLDLWRKESCKKQSKS
jgi:hypothetical protein